MTRALAALLFVATCTDCRTRPFDDAPLTDGSAHPTPDLSRSNFDLAQSIDLAPAIDLAQPNACSQLVDCLARCGTWMPDQPDCFQACGAGSPIPGGSFTSIGTCAQSYCVGGWEPIQNPTNLRCALDATMTNYVDGPGAPAGDCQTCLHHVLDMLLGLPCPATDPACKWPSPACLWEGMEQCR